MRRKEQPSAASAGRDQCWRRLTSYRRIRSRRENWAAERTGWRHGWRCRSRFCPRQRSTWRKVVSAERSSRSESTLRSRWTFNGAVGGRRCEGRGSAGRIVSSMWPLYGRAAETVGRWALRARRPPLRTHLSFRGSGDSGRENRSAAARPLAETASASPRPVQPHQSLSRLKEASIFVHLLLVNHLDVTRGPRGRTPSLMCARQNGPQLSSRRIEEKQVAAAPVKHP